MFGTIAVYEPDASWQEDLPAGGAVLLQPESLYDLAFSGPRIEADAVIRLLGFERADFKRFRDAWIETLADSHRIVVYTRTGGENRLREWPAAVEASPWYLGSEDDTHDATYARLFFQLPDTLEAASLAKSFAIAPVDTSGLWTTELLHRVYRQMDHKMSSDSRWANFARDLSLSLHGQKVQPRHA